MFAIVMMMAILSLMATDLFVPSLPALGHAMNQPVNTIQLTVTLFLLGFAVSQLFYGAVSDRLGRRPPIIVGTSLFVIGSLVCLLAQDFNWLCIGRIIQGIGAGAGLSLSRVILRDSYQGTELAVKNSHLSIFFSISPAIAPCLGGFLQSWFGYRASFVFMFVYGVVLLFLVTFYLKESIQHKHHTLSFIEVVKTYGEFLTNFMFMRYVLNAGMAFGAIILYACIVPFIVQDQLHLTAVDSGYILLMSTLGLTVTALVASKLVHRFHCYLLSKVGLLMLISSGILLIITQLCFGTHLGIVVPLLFLASMSCGLLFPSSLTLAFAQIHTKIGIAGAVYGSIQITISVLINLVLNRITDQGQAVLGIFYVVMGLIGLALLLSKNNVDG